MTITTSAPSSPPSTLLLLSPEGGRYRNYSVIIPAVADRGGCDRGSGSGRRRVESRLGAARVSTVVVVVVVVRPPPPAHPRRSVAIVQIDGVVVPSPSHLRLRSRRDYPDVVGDARHDRSRDGIPRFPTPAEGPPKLLLLDARHRVLDRPVYLGNGGQGWSEPAAMTPTDERRA